MRPDAAHPAAIYDEGNITVTPTRLVVGSTTYPVAGITSVRTDTATKPLLIAVVFVVCVLAAEGTFGFVLGIGLAAAAYFLTLRHTLVLTTAGQEVRALSHKDPQRIRRIAAAVSHAVDIRG